MSGSKSPVYGVMAQFETPGDILHAAEKIRDMGYTRCDAFTPFPVHGLDDALRIPGSKVPWIVLAGAFAGGSGAILMQWWMSAVDYPIKIAGKPFFSIPAFVPVTFELSILLSAFAAVLGMLVLNGLPRLYHPVFKHSTFHRATDDKFFLAIESRDPKFRPETARQALIEVGGSNVEVVED
jgi:hypothetical protein